MLVFSVTDAELNHIFTAELMFSDIIEVLLAFPSVRSLLRRLFLALGVLVWTRRINVIL